ncbi:MAG TPA: DNA-binding protein [Noviherbaspirillum sp.]|uniref:DNA-binding protein n=1 Tax=Noviherbaspirillum sp. TaxID=1926288 RepID=UPI002DDCC3A4|nr:DNA-binding protein [Noviherbaspirillum sp.]HEV2609787.1 DNA-binding protein [Noviherbaspirillum sp.]
MARSGLHKSEVRKARDTLLAQNRHPSVDAVRIALGNTGSKSTIHKYLKELDDEDGAADLRTPSLSDTLQDLVQRLAAQLQAEARTEIDALQAAHADRARQHADELAAARAEIGQRQAQVQHLEWLLQQEAEAHHQTRQLLQQETIARHTAQQQAGDLQVRLADNETHRQSLEDKHRHAYEALEHYRQSVKVQRDGDERRHELQLQQVQATLRQAQQAVVVKQEEATRLNQEGVRLIAQLTHTRQMLHDAQENNRQLAQGLETLQAKAQQAPVLEAQLAERNAQVQQLAAQLAATSATVNDLHGQIRTLELSIAQSRSKAEAEQGLVAELRTYLENRDRSATKEAGV